MGFMLVFGWFYMTLVETFGVDIAPVVIAFCERILAIPGIEHILNLI